ncbi:hypothetical protein [Burkholderia sp. WAC0059]|uniref:hypothetical protein n=1 Tax=Burkholderia sp. WAC0059 TaxID=2066022 RepID=UPI0015E06A6E|nr:hypothetical protein [Burkholderia sp. WAC0059]
MPGKLAELSTRTQPRPTAIGVATSRPGFAAKGSESEAVRKNADFGRPERLASLRATRVARETLATAPTEDVVERVTTILARQRQEAAQGRGIHADLSRQPLPMLNLHAHFGGSIVSKLIVDLKLDLPEKFDFDAEVKKEDEANFYTSPETKGLAPYLKQYTTVSRKVPIPQPVFARMMAHELAYSCAQNGNVAAEYRVNGLRDLFSIDKVKPENYSDYSEEYVRSIADGLDSGNAAAQKDGFKPTVFGLIFDGNRFDPRELFKKDEGVSKEEKLQKSRASALRLVEVQFREAIRQVNIPGNPCKVSGVGLCGLEEGHSVEYFGKAIDIIHDHNEKMHRFGQHDKILGLSIHAGEVGTREEATAEVVKAITLGWKPHTPVRIGHGVLADLKAVKTEVEKAGIPFDQIHFEMCPTSNIQIISGISGDNHPVLPFLREGGNAAVYSDNDAMSGRVEKEPEVVGATEQEVLQMAMHGIPSSFRLQQLGLVDKVTKETLEKYAQRGIHLPTGADAPRRMQVAQ